MLEAAKLQAELAAHLETRPAGLGWPVPSLESEEYQTWRKAMQVFVDRKALLEGLLAGVGMGTRDIVIPGPNGYIKKASQKGVKRGAA